MGVTIALAAAVMLCAASSALAQKSTSLRDCEKLAAVKFKRENPAFKRFEIDRVERWMS